MAQKKTKLIAGAAVVLLFVFVVAFAIRFDLSALPEPGHLELALATRAKHFLIGRASRNGASAQPSPSNGGLAEGKRLYETECAMCHGMNGRARTDNGRWMYPRAADLTSPAVQQYTDPELFWIIKNGIRLSGMPAFAKVETDQHISDIVQYVRSFRSAAPPTASAAE